MALHFGFAPTHRILVGRFTGLVTDEELTNFYRMATLMVEALDPLAGITDFSGVEALEVTPETIRTLASFPPIIPQRNRPRVVVASTESTFEMAQNFKLEGGMTRPNLHVVRTIQEAWAIIGVDEPEIRPIPEALETSDRFKFRHGTGRKGAAGGTK